MRAKNAAFLARYSGPNYKLVDNDETPPLGVAVESTFQQGGYLVEGDSGEVEQKKREAYLKRYLEGPTQLQLHDTGKYTGRPVYFVPGHLVGGAEYGPHKAEIAVVGKTISADDMAMHRHWSTESAELLRQEFALHGLDLDKAYGTNAVKFPPPYESMAKVPAAWAKECSYFLRQELIQVAPKFLLLCGADALKAVAGKKATLKAYKGHPFEVSWLPGTQAMVTNGPAEVLRTPEKSGALSVGVRLFAQMVRGESTEQGADCNYRTFWKLDDLREFVNEVMEYKVFAVDVETTGLEYGRGVLLTIQLSWAPKHAAVIALRSGPGGRQFKPCISKAVSELRRLLCRTDVSVTGHNFRFDLKWLIDVGLDLTSQWTENGFDTMLASHALDETAEHDLSSCSLRDTNMGKYDATMDQYKAKGLMHWEVPDEDLHYYGAGDADASFRLYQVYRQRLWEQHCQWCHDEGGDIDPLEAIYAPDSRMASLYGWAPTLWNLYKYVILPVNRSITEMEVTGMLADRDRLVEMIKLFADKRDELEAELLEAVGDPAFNPRSPQQCQKLLFGAPDSVDAEGRQLYCLGLRPVKTTGKRGKLWDEAEAGGAVWYTEGVGWESNQYAPSTDGESLAILAEDQDCYEAQVLRNFRFIDQVCKNFLREEEVNALTGDVDYQKGLAGLLHADGRLRTSISQLTDTGRWRSSAPNLQNLPKGREGTFGAIFGKDVKVPPIRSGIIPPDGHVMIEADFESAESHTLAALAGDDNMKEDLAQTDEDGNLMSVHSVTACKIFNLPCTVSEYEIERKENKIYAGYRIAAKSVNFGIPYQRGGAAIARQVMREGVECTEEDGKRWVEEWYGRYTENAKFIDACKDAVTEIGWIRTPWGRLRHFYPSPYNAVIAAMQREACNYPIQSTVADSLSLGITNLEKERNILGMSSRIILAVHDAVMLYVPYEEVTTILQLLQKCLSDDLVVPGIGLQYKIDTEICSRWGVDAPPEILEKCGITE